MAAFGWGQKDAMPPKRVVKTRWTVTAIFSPPLAGQRLRACERIRTRLTEHYISISRVGFACEIRYLVDPEIDSFTRSEGCLSVAIPALTQYPGADVPAKECVGNHTAHGGPDARKSAQWNRARRPQQRAGKSTSAPSLLRGTLGVAEFVDADTIARGLAGFDPDRAAIPAGRVMLARLRELAGQQVSFAFESTLASRTLAPWLGELVGHGYRFHLIFLWLPSADFAVDRVADRVRLGGHDVPEATVRRRYPKLAPRILLRLPPLGQFEGERHFVCQDLGTGGL